MSYRGGVKRKLVSFYRNIMHEKASPEYFVRGLVIGMFYGGLIPFGLQL